MVINENNSYTNSFTAGMNSDSAYDQLKNNNYVYAKNIRITKNLLLGTSQDDYASVHEGIVTPVYDGVNAVLGGGTGEDETKFILLGEAIDILSVDSVDDIGVIVGIVNNKLAVYRVRVEPETDANHIDRIKNPTLWWRSNETFDDVSSISTVLYKELDNVIKLYIATGKYPIITLRVDDQIGPYVNTQDDILIDDFISNRVIPTDCVYIQGITSGKLKTSLVQYTYRYYNKYGITTQLAPLTNKIQVIDPNRNKEIGNAEDTETSLGFILKINLNGFLERYERLQIYRVQYIKPEVDAEVALIYDGDIKSNDGYMLFNDVGIDALQNLTIEEFSAMSGLIITPTVIETNQQYMFAANVKDETIIKNVDILVQGDGPNKTINTVTAEVVLSNNLAGDILSVYRDRENPFGNPTPALHFTIPYEYIPADYKNLIILLDRVYTPYGGTGEEYEPIQENTRFSIKYGNNIYNNTFTFGTSVEDIERDWFRNNTQKEDYVIITSPDPNYTSNTDVYLITVMTTTVGYSINVLPNTSKENFTDNEIKLYFEDRNINSSLPKSTYNDIFTSSLLRSLRRGESYKYGIVYYDKYGRRSDVLSIGDIAIPEPYEDCPFLFENGKLLAKPIGVRIELPLPLIDAEVAKDIIGCLIVRRSSKSIYQKTLMQVALARPVQQYLYTLRNFDGKTASPYYPTGYLFSNHVRLNSYYYTDIPQSFMYDDYLANSRTNEDLFLIFSAEIDFRRDDAVSILNQNESYLNPIYFLFPDTSILRLNGSIELQIAINNLLSNTNTINTCGAFTLTRDNKQSQRLVLDYYEKHEAVAKLDGSSYEEVKYPISIIKDVKIPKWYDGFSDLQYNGSNIVGGVKKYKSFTTSIDKYKYVNWVASGLYDFRIYYEDSQPNVNVDPLSLFLYNRDHHNNNRLNLTDTVAFERSGGYIGPGPSCLLMKLDYGDGMIDIVSKDRYGCAIANIQHDIEFLNSEPDEFVQYFGFGNFFKLEYKTSENKYYVIHANGNKDTTMTVFDGDIYITPHEITTMYKAYDFLSFDTLESMQVTNYVPLESKVNTYFDYGMNLLNTDNNNLIYDGGSIEGVISQDRPVHQYNMVYSDNDASNDVFTLTITNKNETNLFKQRTYYSEPKTNGEFIDNFNVFKAVSFIDVDSKYGEITDLFTDKNTLYYWQNTAFGKFSVNERSLINDQNGNTIMLGLAGILSRNDYISTKYGMRPYDYCVTSTEKGVYWIDINNRAIVASDGKQVVNLGELLNVQNIINNNISLLIPKIDYDLLNDELLCKCLNYGELLVFNLKYNIATSIYTRVYIDMMYIRNHMYGIYTDSNNLKLYITKYNYLTDNDKQEYGLQYLTPVQLSFVSNGTASITKVFDSQTIVPIKRDLYNGIDVDIAKPEDHDDAVESYLENTEFTFETDILNKNKNSINPHTDREGNIIYNIPRYGSDEWGNRMRGKWLKVDITNTNPYEYFTISHVITKTRLSYS